MLTISYNGHNIPLDASFSLRLTWTNPACFFDKIPGDAGIGIEIPVNEYSRTYFGNPHRFEKYTSGNDRKFSGVDIRYGGMLLMCGTLVITNADQRTYSGWLQSDLGVLGEEQREKFIDELPWQDDGADAEDFANKSEYSEDTDDYCTAEIYNPIWWDEKGKMKEETVFYYDEDGERLEKSEDVTVLTTTFKENFRSNVNMMAGDNSVNVIGTKSDSNAVVVSPFLFLSYAVKEILKMCHWYTTDKNILKYGDTISDPSPLAGLFIYNNWNIAYNTFATAIDLVPRWNPETLTYTDEEVNRITAIYWHFDKVYYNRLVPHIALADFILSLQNYLNIVFVWKAGHKVDIIDRDEIVDSTPLDINDYFREEWIIGERKDVTLKYIAQYDKEDRMFGDEFHDLSDRRDDIDDSVADFAELEAITDDPVGTIRLVRDENNYYEFKWSVNVGEDENRLESHIDILAWQFISTGPQPYFYGTGDEEEEIKTNASTLKMNMAIGSPIANGRPAVLQKGNYKMIKNVWNDFSFRLMFYHGRDYAYTWKSDDTVDLNWEEDNGIFAMRWEKWSRFWSNRLPVEGTFAFPIHIIYFVINNITSKFRTRHGEFIIEEMEVEIGLNLIGNTKIRGYKI